MARLLCIANQKGGVGKTTTAVNLACAFALAGQRCLLVDLDPQCNATSGLGLELPVRIRGFHYLLEPEMLRSFVLSGKRENLDVLPGSPRLIDVEQALEKERDREQRLSKALAPVTSNYEYVLVDCPPSLGTLTMNALFACDAVVIPIQCEYFAMEGLSKITHSIKAVSRQKAGKLAIEGIVMTMHDSNLQLAREVTEEVRSFFGNLVYDTIIPRDVALSEAPSYGASIFEYAIRSRGARAYLELAKEVMTNESQEATGTGAEQPAFGGD